jgi:GNAT superfamily N-acetyltransferase
VEPIDVRHPALPALFDPSTPNAPMLFAVLEGALPGRAIADHPDAPTVAAVQTSEWLAFVSRTDSQEAFDAALNGLRRDAMVGIAWAEGQEGGPITPEAPAKVLERLGFDAITGDPDGRLAAFRGELPTGITVRPIDAELLARCEWRELVESAHGSPEAFLEHAFGLCLMRGDEIVAEAYAPFIGNGVAEVGVVTAETHRGQGLGSIAVAFLGEALADRGLAMYWSCDADNLASIRVANKVGFGAPRPFQLLLYRPLPE